VWVSVMGAWVSVGGWWVTPNVGGWVGVGKCTCVCVCLCVRVLGVCGKVSKLRSHFKAERERAAGIFPLQ